MADMPRILDCSVTDCSYNKEKNCGAAARLRRKQKGSLFMLRRYQECDAGGKHERVR